MGIHWASPINDNETGGLASDWKTEIPHKPYPIIRKYGNTEIRKYEIPHDDGTNLITSFNTQFYTFCIKNSLLRRPTEENTETVGSWICCFYIFCSLPPSLCSLLCV